METTTYSEAIHQHISFLSLLLKVARVLLMRTLAILDFRQWNFSDLALLLFLKSYLKLDTVM